jgi:hypothetical protein
MPDIFYFYQTVIILTDTLSFRHSTVQGGFSDTTKMKSGWILGSNGQLLFWVPPWNQTGLWHPRNTAIIGVQPTKLDVSQFTHGSTWSKVKSDFTC